MRLEWFSPRKHVCAGRNMFLPTGLLPGSKCLSCNWKPMRISKVRQARKVGWIYWSSDLTCQDFEFFWTSKDTKTVKLRNQSSSPPNLQQARLKLRIGLLEICVEEIKVKRPACHEWLSGSLSESGIGSNRVEKDLCPKSAFHYLYILCFAFFDWSDSQYWTFVAEYWVFPKSSSKRVEGRQLLSDAFPLLGICLAHLRTMISSKAALPSDFGEGNFKKKDKPMWKPQQLVDRKCFSLWHIMSNRKHAMWNKKHAMWNTKHVTCKHIPYFEKWPIVSWMEPWLRNLTEPNVSWMEPSLRNLSEPNISWMEPSLRNLSKPNVSWMEPSLRNLSEPNVSWMEPSLRNLSEPNVSWTEPSLRNLSEPNVSWMEPSLRNLSEPNVSWMEPGLRNLSEPNVSWTEPSLRNLTEANVSWMEPWLRNLTFHEWHLHFGTLRNLTFHEWNLDFGTSRNLTFHEWNLHFGTSRNLMFHEWNLHFGTSRNLTFHEWNLDFGTSRNLTFHEWNLHFGTGSIPSEPLGTWCKVSGGCPKPPRSFIGRTPSLSGCWGKKW